MSVEISLQNDLDKAADDVLKNWAEKLYGDAIKNDPWLEDKLCTLIMNKFASKVTLSVQTGYDVSMEQDKMMIIIRKDR